MILAEGMAFHLPTDCGESLIRVENHLRGFHRNSGTIMQDIAPDERARSTVEFLHQETAASHI